MIKTIKKRDPNGSCNFVEEILPQAERKKQQAAGDAAS